jgi:hypothetical protein
VGESLYISLLINVTKLSCVFGLERNDRTTMYVILVDVLSVNLFDMKYRLVQQLRQSSGEIKTAHGLRSVSGIARGGHDTRIHHMYRTQPIPRRDEAIRHPSVTRCLMASCLLQ